MTWTVPLTDLVLTDADVEAVLDTYRRGWLTMGPKTQELEARFASATGTAHAVAVSSGTAALHLSLLAAGVGEGDEVLVPALTFVAAAGAVRAVGATPVFVDSIGPEDPNVDPEDVAARITPRTRAIVATHLFGYACDVEALVALAARHGLAVVEDAAQSVLATTASGPRVGAVGDAGCFSFFSKKQLAVGEGGMVTTDDEELAARVRSLRSHAMTSGTWSRHRGHADSYDVLDVGFNYRLDEPRAALGLSRLDRLEDDIAARRSLARAYRQALSGLDGVTVPWTDADVERASHFSFPVLLDDGERRDAVRADLRAQGIQTTFYPSVPTLAEYASDACPRARAIAARHACLPMASTYGTDEVATVLGALRTALGG